MINEQQYGFMMGKSTTDAMFSLRVLMEKYTESQKEMHCVFVDLEKAYDGVPREELSCMRKLGVAEEYLRVIHDMAEDTVTAVTSVVGGAALSSFLFATVMDKLTGEIREESLWTMMFADDIVICSESRSSWRRPWRGGDSSSDL